MRLPRFRIAWAMGFVAVVALDLFTIRDVSKMGRIGTLVELGALPMANVLAVSAQVRHWRPGGRSFLVGFEIFGIMALVFYVALVSYFSNQMVHSYLVPSSISIEGFIGWQRPYLLIPIALTVHVVMLVLPQVAFALMGGLLSRRFKRQSVSVSR